MRGHRFACVCVASALAWSSSAADSPHASADKLAAKLVDHFRSTPCATLDKERKARKGAVRSAMEHRAAQRLREDPELRAYFLGKVAVPVADKMLVCGFIP